jgi:hypothetical protein
VSIERTNLEVATIIEQFINGTGGRWDWDDFCSNLITDPDLDSIRNRCDGLASEFPPDEKGHYCSQHGIKVMREIGNDLRRPK